jgi:hypothetical protein
MSKIRLILVLGCVAIGSLVALPLLCNAQEKTSPGSAKGGSPSTMQRLAPDCEAWLDLKHRRVVLRGEIVFREGPLELFACPKGTKEHEAIIVCPTKAHVVHAALLALGAEPGHPVAFRPDYRPAEGAEVEVTVFWTDAHGKQQRARGQDWVRDAKTGQALDAPWVFAGSGFWKDEATGQNHYLAESGDLICVSNFPSAMLDLPIASSQSNESLMFECFTERIPPIGTKVILTLTPKHPQNQKGTSSASPHRG